MAQNNPLDIYNTSAILDEYGQVLHDGCILQVIYAGLDGQINQPIINLGQPNNGQPSGDDSLLFTSSVGYNVPPGLGLFYFTIVTYANHTTGYPANGDYIYIRAFTDTSLISSTSYGDADLYQVTNQLGSAYVVSVNILLNNINDQDLNILPKKYCLFQNYPNPFNPVTTINYTIRAKCSVKLSVFDVTGREVKILINQSQNAGEYSVLFNASNLTSGVYIYKLQVGSFEQSRKMILLR